MLLPIPVWLRFNTKTPVKILAWNHTNGSAVTVAGDADIKGFKDLGQKQIAVPYWYSMHNIVFQMGLKKAGLTPVIQPQSRPLAENQVNLFVLPPPEMPVSLSGKKIDGFVVAEPFNAVAELKTRAKIMRFTGDIWMNHPCCVVVMDEALIREKPVFTQKVINGVVRAMRFCIQNPRKTARILSREGGGYLPFSEKTLLRVFTTYSPDIYGPGNVPQAIQHPEWKVRRIGFQPYPYRSATRLILREMADTRMEGDTSFLQTLDVDEAASALVDDTFVKKAVTLAGGPELFSQIDYQDPWRREEVFEL
jgi:NitT/TauT family transport system substrate-binding protein